MTVFVAFLRAVNVGGTGKLPMQDLRALCTEAGFTNVQTYIASGNVVLESSQSEARVKAAMEAALARHAGKLIGVVLRPAAELAAILTGNPFPQARPDRTAILLLDAIPAGDVLDGVTGHGAEEIRPGRREITVHYPDGIGRSRLRIPAARHGTARNMNTIAALVAMTRR